MPIKSREKIPRFNPRTDIPTIPNAMSIAGAILAWRGAKRIDTAAGIAQVAAGRSRRHRRPQNGADKRFRRIAGCWARQSCHCHYPLRDKKQKTRTNGNNRRHHSF